MREIQLSPFEYLAPPEGAFWKWRERTQVATWFNGETIAFRPELEPILRRLAEGGLPPLSLILLVLAATRDSCRQALARKDNLINLVRSFGGLPKDDRHELTDGLMRIAKLPGELRHPIEARTGLVEFVFESGGPRTSGENAKVICDTLSYELSSRSVRLRNVPPTKHELQHGLRTLLKGLARLDEEALRLRQWTGLDQLIGPAEIEPMPVEQVRSLIESLQDDQELHGVARLARALMAAVHLPRPIQEPEELPIGGFSDIANRGSPDRLLVSELAHDNLTLAVRVALNEALYLRREAPPKTPSPARRILIDAGIRLWGVPRVFATAVAMALTATADGHSAVTTFRANADSMDPADLTTRQGLVDHLAALTLDAHPGRALERFVTDLPGTNAAADRVVVTSEKAIADREFQRGLARHQGVGIYLATVNRRGQFRLLHQSGHARKLICEADLPLEDLLRRRRRPTASLFDERGEEGLPAIFHVRPFPLRIPRRKFAWERSWVVPDTGCFEFATDGRLLLWDEPGRGPRQLADHIRTKANLVWADPEPTAGMVTAVLGDKSGPGKDLRLLSVDTMMGQTSLVSLELGHAKYTISGQGGMIFGISDAEACVLDSVDGRCVDRVEIPGQHLNIRLERVRGRFLRHLDSNDWYALGFDGQRTTIDKVFDGQNASDVELVTMFDWVGHEGPVGVTKRGELYYPEDGQIRRLWPGDYAEVSVHDVSLSGNHVMLERQYSRRTIEVASGVESHSWLHHCEDPKWVPDNTGPVLRRKFKAVVAGDRLGLALVSKNEGCFRVQLDDDRLLLKDSGLSAAGYAPHARPFENVVYHGPPTYRLVYAEWADGSRAYMDYRGLLHLRSADSSLPEVSLVLDASGISGWCSDGRIWGDEYFIGDEANTEPKEVFHDVIQPFVDRLQ